MNSVSHHLSCRRSDRNASSWGIKGFTLIELMIVVAVIAILAAIALPSYQEHVRKSRRAQAKADLVELAQFLERRHTVDNHYGGALAFSVSPREATGTSVMYNITRAPIAGNPPNPQTFVLRAEPANAQQNDRCGTLTLSNTGAKTRSGAVAESECW